LSAISVTRLMDTYALEDRGKNLWIEGHYPQSIETFEEAIQTNSDELTNYWYLGLAYLLQGEEETAQLVWLSAIAEQGGEDSDEVVQSLVQTLSTEAKRLCDIEQFRDAWTIRHHIREFSPQDLTNLILLIELSIKLEEFTEESLEELGVIELLQLEDSAIELPLLISCFAKILEYPAAETLSFAEACLTHITDREQWAEMLTTAAATYAFERRLTKFAIALVELCIQHEPNNLIALGYLPRFHTDCHNFKEAVKAAKEFYSRCTTSETLFFANCVLLHVLMRQGDWQEIPVVASRLKVMISDLIRDKPTQLSLHVIRFLIVSTGVFLYLKDDPQENRQIQNQAGQIFLENIKANAPTAIKPISRNFKCSKERLKIGYIASTLRDHSVGWLSRWLFQHHDREAFEISAYLICQRPNNPFFETWFANQVDQFRFLPNGVSKAVQIIRDDEVDILIDLDSTTADQTCTILALKPAPIQATWLGYDASGLPTIDYFIADPYVLPDDAQNYYREKIWRLPHTYIAVDGFEIGVPTIRRSDLDISDNAVVYWSSQTGLKRNPNTVRLQMQILQKVPNSYFLIKGIGDQDIIRDFFTKAAQEEGVSPERLRFLPMMTDEYIHRANLQIADVVLDTYPYNGATTTLETLWAGVPLVTLAGQQFAARNSYAFLMNVGVTEGIAWTDEEYVEWGVRLGQDESLRQQVSWKLKQSRHTSPLWNTKQFTREMENAYHQMWSIYKKLEIS
jgi:predicted O-linked N-acetylglucosamine transferase (SPINDLY family)